MTTKLIVIVGITGIQGGSVADVFLTEPGWRIRGITRDINKSAAQSLSAKGIEMVQGDLNQVSSIRAAFEGANAIYAVTDFWAPFWNPSTKEKLPPGQLLNQYCYDLEVQQGKNLADAAANVKTLERYVYSALTSFKERSKGKYTWVYHFDSKAKVVDYVTKNLSKLAAKMSVVQIGLYATHWAAAPVLAPQKQPDGTFLLTLTANPDAPMPMIDAKKDTGHFVRALIQLPPGKTVLAYGSMISWKDYMTLWAKILKLPGGFYKQITVDDFDKMAPGGLGREVGEGWMAQSELGYSGGDPTVLHPKDLGVEMSTTTIEEYIESEDWSPLLG